MSPLHWLCLAFLAGTAYGTLVTLLAVRLVRREADRRRESISVRRQT